MSDAGETRTPLRIRGAADLLAALRSPEPAVRLAVTRHVRDHPREALAYGAHDGRDVVDELIHQTYQREGFILWSAAFQALAAFDGPRVVETVKKVMAGWERADVVYAAAHRLAREPLDALVPFLLPLLMQDRSPIHARAAARLLARTPLTDEAARLRTALLSDDGELPALVPASLAHWLRELEGPFAADARRALENEGEPAFALLASCAGALPERTGAWLLGWGARAHPALTAPLLAPALASGALPLVEAALAAMASLPPERVPALARRAAAPWARHADARLRRAAAAAGALGVDWAERVRVETDGPARAAAVARLGAEAEASAEAIAVLAALLGDPDWRVRAAAAEALIACGETAAPSVRPFLHAADAASRAAAARVLAALGEEELVERTLAP